MAGIKEFQVRIETDKVFASKFKGINADNKIIALAKAEGYDLELENELYS